jgi:hypothetical protein
VSLTKEQILGVEDRVLREIQVPEWGGSVWIRSLTVEEQIAFGEESSASEGTEHMTTVSLSFWVVNDKGDRMFSIEEAKALMKKNGAAVQRLFQAGLEINNPVSNRAVEAERKNS